jgi:hypothetical protein
MMFNTTFNNISAISQRSVSLVEKTVPRENRRPADKSVFERTTLVVIGTAYIFSCKSNDYMTTTTTVPILPIET